MLNTSEGGQASLVLCEKQDGVAVLTLNRPDKLNAMSGVMRAQFGRHLQSIEADPEIRIVLLKGNGRAFCVGADTNAMPENALSWRERIHLAQQHHTALVKMDKIVIAAVQGIAAGGGASLALAADILIMADDASLRFPFVRLGLIPDGGCSFLLQSKLGAPLAHDLMLTGGVLGADEAQRYGLTRRVVPAAGLEAASQALIEELSALPAEALMLTKAVSRQTWTVGMDAALMHEADAFALASTLPGHQQARTDLLARRKLR